MDKVIFGSGVEKKKSSVDLVSEICEKYNFSQSSEMISLKQEIIASPENSQDKIGEWTDRMREVVAKLPSDQQTHADMIGHILQLGIYLEAGFIEDAFILLDDLFTESQGMGFEDILKDLEIIEASMNQEN